MSNIRECKLTKTNTWKVTNKFCSFRLFASHFLSSRPPSELYSTSPFNQVVIKLHNHIHNHIIDIILEVCNMKGSLKEWWFRVLGNKIYQKQPLHNLWSILQTCDNLPYYPYSTRTMSLTPLSPYPVCFNFLLPVSIRRILLLFSAQQPPAACIPSRQLCVSYFSTRIQQ